MTYTEWSKTNQRTATLLASSRSSIGIGIGTARRHGSLVLSFAQRFGSVAIKQRMEPKPSRKFIQIRCRSSVTGFFFFIFSVVVIITSLKLRSNTHKCGVWRGKERERERDDWSFRTTIPINAILCLMQCDWDWIKKNKIHLWMMKDGFNIGKYLHSITKSIWIWSQFDIINSRI